MFNFFKKKKETSIEETFLNSFSENQKAAMIYTLMLMVGSDGYYEDNKLDYTIEQAKILNFNMEGKAMKVYERENADFAYSIISKFEEDKKNWYSVLLGTILLVNRKQTENELQLVDKILRECGISEDQFNDVNMKTQSFLNKMK